LVSARGLRSLPLPLLWGVLALVGVTAVNLYAIERGAFSKDGFASPLRSLAEAFSFSRPSPSASAAASETPVDEAAGATFGAVPPELASKAIEDDVADDTPKTKSPKGSSSKSTSKKNARTVSEALSAGCSTSSVNDLSRQIIAEARCVDASAFAPVPARKNLVRGSQVFLFLEAPARDQLIRVLDAHPKQTLTVNSALRTIAQQYLLFRWAATKRCGIEVAAVPGESNHEGGLALDVREPGTWRPILEKEGFKWLGPSDKVHFDFRGPGSVDHTGLDVLAFQRLWNRNHADDKIAETGHFTQETEARLNKAPTAGFPVGPTCKPADGTPRADAASHPHRASKK
jgi:hypothetical protein